MTAIAARLRGRASRTVVILAVVIVALIAANVVLLLMWQSQGAVNDARTAAVTAADKKVPSLLSYSYSSFAADLARAEGGATDKFRSTYGKLMTSQVEPTARQHQVITQATVASASVISAQSGTATLLMFLDQQTKTNTKSESVLNDTAVRVVMRQVNGTWLVDDLVPRS